MARLKASSRAAPERRVRVGLLVVAAASATVAVLVSLGLFPHLSINSDESVYLLQADALRHGHLFPPAPPPTEAFRPWLTITDGDHYVTKYAPVHPGVLAFFMWLGLSTRFALAFLAAATVMAMYLLAREVLSDRRQALLAAFLLGASPLFAIQSGTYLPYVGNVLLLTLFAATLLRGVRTGGRWLLVVAGVLLGTAVFARPYDAVLFCGPLLVWFGWNSRRQVGRFAWLAAGAAPVGFAMLLYFRAATGSPFRLPFQVIDRADTIGFGRRRFLPGTPYFDFDLSVGAHALVANLHLLVIWSFGGLLLTGFTVAALQRRPRSGAAIALAVTGVCVALGYMAFWGAAIPLTWDGPFRLGPWYLVPVLVPLCVLGARGLALLHQRDRWLARGALAFMAIFSLVVIAGTVREATGPAQVDRRLWRAIEGAHLADAVVFVPGAALGNPIQQATNTAAFDGPIIWAVQRGGCADAEVLRKFPGRRGYTLNVPPWYRDLRDVPFRSDAVLQTITPTCAPWARRPETGTATAALHSERSTPARIITPGDDEPNAFMLEEDGTYHLYSSQDSFLAPNVSVRVSARREGGFGSSREVMPRLPAWVQRGFTWAPDVRRVGDRYVLWFTAATHQLRPDGQAFVKCIGVAAADSPLGPFEPLAETPTICQRDRFGSIDPRTFVDDDGTLWLHWKSDDNANVAGVGRSSIYARRLAADGVTLVGPSTRILEVDQAWEGRIIEAPQMVEADGRHWLFYSGNLFSQPNYAIGVAECEGPAGPCEKPSDQPWLASNAQGSGPGENSLFRDADGWWTVYAPNSVEGGQLRPVALAPVTFGRDGPIIAAR